MSSSSSNPGQMSSLPVSNGDPSKSEGSSLTSTSVHSGHNVSTGDIGTSEETESRKRSLDSLTQENSSIKRAMGSPSTATESVRLNNAGTSNEGSSSNAMHSMQPQHPGLTPGVPSLNSGVPPMWGNIPPFFNMYGSMPPMPGQPGMPSMPLVHHPGTEEQYAAAIAAAASTGIYPIPHGMHPNTQVPPNSSTVPSFEYNNTTNPTNTDNAMNSMASTIPPNMLNVTAAYYDSPKMKGIPLQHRMMQQQQQRPIQGKPVYGEPSFIFLVPHMTQKPGHYTFARAYGKCHYEGKCMQGCQKFKAQSENPSICAQCNHDEGFHEQVFLDENTDSVAQQNERGNDAYMSVVPQAYHPVSHDMKYKRANIPSSHISHSNSMNTNNNHHTSMHHNALHNNGNTSNTNSILKEKKRESMEGEKYNMNASPSDDQIDQKQRKQTTKYLNALTLRDLSEICTERNVSKHGTKDKQISRILASGFKYKKSEGSSNPNNNNNSSYPSYPTNDPHSIGMQQRVLEPHGMNLMVVEGEGRAPVPGFDLQPWPMLPPQVQLPQTQGSLPSGQPPGLPNDVQWNTQQQ